MAVLNCTYLDGVLVSMVVIVGTNKHFDVMNMDNKDESAIIDARAIMHCSIDNAMRFEKENKYVDSSEIYLWYMGNELVGAYLLDNECFTDLFVKKSDAFKRIKLVDYSRLKRQFKNCARESLVGFTMVHLQALVKEVMEVEQ